jgi:hypothetical protein
MLIDFIGIPNPSAKLWDQVCAAVKERGLTIA